MLFTDPIGNLNIEGRTAQEIDKDQERLARLMCYLPPEYLLREKVKAFILSFPQKTPLCDIDEVAKVLEKALREDGHKINASKIKKMLERAFYTDNFQNTASLFEDSVTYEVNQTRNLFLEYFSNTLLKAWDMWEKPAEGLPFDIVWWQPNFKRGGKITPTEWKEAMYYAKARLQNNVALDRDGINAVWTFFSSTINQVLNHFGPVEFPDGVNIILDENSHLCLKAR